MKENFFNKKVLITGDTGFKGSWLSLWMHKMGAKVLGLSNDYISSPSNFKALNLEKKIAHKKIDIRNFKKIKKVILNFQPDFIFHLAAEAIVKRAYANPKYTWETNTIGTINVLETLKKMKKNVCAIIITSDKVYKNLEILRGYNEKDVLGSLDPYSASKAAADLSVQSYFKSYFKNKKNIRMCIARAGNVIGGGDWSEGRLIPDCIKHWSKNKKVKIKNPQSTRPWQHVLDVLNGYITLAYHLKKNNRLNGEAFNFGPKIEKKREVINVVKEMKKYWSKAKWKIVKNKKSTEAKFLQLNSKKAKKKLNWSCKLNLKNTIRLTVNWYKEYYFNNKKIYNFSIQQINSYEK